MLRGVPQSVLPSQECPGLTTQNGTQTSQIERRNRDKDNPVTAVTSRAERARQDELRQLARLMRERVGLAAVPPARPLHKMGNTTTADTATTGGQRP